MHLSTNSSRLLLNGEGAVAPVVMLQQQRVVMGQAQASDRLAVAAGVCPNGGSSVVTWTRVCGRAGQALVLVSAVEIVDTTDADTQCAATL